MSYLANLSDRAVVSASGHAATLGTASQSAAMDRETVRRVAWALFRAFERETIRVPFLFGMTWKVRLGDLRPLWERLFGPEVGEEEIPAPFNPFDPAA